MKVLYGVQATGNGHITRARVMAPALEAAGIEVDYLFSGREPEKLFNMEPFGDFQCRQGLTFYMDGSKVNYTQTLTRNNPLRLVRDICSLDLAGYDLVITDFEPVTAWAAKLRGVPSVGIAHQYAFLYRLPDTKTGIMLKNQIRGFAPAKHTVGLHWDHFDQPICPPLIQSPLYAPSIMNNKVVVYLPHDDLAMIRTELSRFPDIAFYIYTGVEKPLDDGNMHVRPFSRDGFQQDLASCTGVICNSGFGLLSEAIQYGKKIITIPQRGQVEQESNAEVLEHLNLGWVITDLGSERLGDWLALPMPDAQVYPDLATILAGWVADGCIESIADLAKRAWQSDKNVLLETV